MPKSTDEIKKHVHRNLQHFNPEGYRGPAENDTAHRWSLEACRESECVLHLAGEFTALLGAVNNCLKGKAPRVWEAREKILDAKSVLSRMRMLTESAYENYHRTYRLGREDPAAHRKVHEAFDVLETAEDLHQRVLDHVKDAVRYYGAGMEESATAHRLHNRKGEPD